MIDKPAIWTTSEPRKPSAAPEPYWIWNEVPRFLNVDDAGASREQTAIGERLRTVGIPLGLKVGMPCEVAVRLLELASQRSLHKNKSAKGAG